jgi:hypothetical protein
MNPGLGVTAVQPQLGERRKFRRYRYNVPISIRTADGQEARGMSVDISETGMLIVGSASLKVGEVVELEPIGGGVAKTIVRRNSGKLYGFEFPELSAAQVGQIRKMCEKLPQHWSKSTVFGSPRSAAGSS